MRKLLFGRSLRRLGWKPEVPVEVEDELRHHLELLVAEGMQRGLSREEALDQARSRFGSDAAIRQACEQLARERDRRAALGGMLADLGDDLRWAWRSLRRTPAYSLSSGLTLALVVAANALAFTLVYSILLRPLPYPEPDRLVALNEVTLSGDVWELSVPNLDAVRAQSRSFEGMAGWSAAEVTLVNAAEVTLVNEDTPRVRITMVSAGFFEALGTAPLTGRVLGPADQAGNAGQSLVLSHQAWQTHFGGDPAILGRTVRLNSDLFTVVGVMPPSFRFPDREVAAWVPLGPPQPWMQNRSVHLFQVVARLRPQVTTEAAREELATVFDRVQAEHSGEDPGHTPLLRGLQDYLTGSSRLTLLLLLASVGGILLLASTNLASLAVTRASQRDGELAMRAALGATRWRLVRQLAVESGLLGLIAGVAGVVLAAVLLKPLLLFLPASVPRPGRIGLDPLVTMVTLGIGGGAGLVIGLLAALRVGRIDPAARLRAETLASTSRRERLRLQQGLVAAQLALSVILLAGAGLLLRSFREVIQVDPGYRTRNVVVAMTALPSSRYDDARVASWYDDLPARLEKVPGVVAAATISSLPVSGGDAAGGLTIEGRPFAPGEAPAVTYRRVSPGYFRTMGIPLLQGRQFDEHDRGEREMVVIVSQSLARRFWPNDDPLGKRIKVGPPEGEPWLTIVGVVGNVRHAAPEQEPRLDTYEPQAQRLQRSMGIVALTAGDPRALAPAVVAALREGDPELPVWSVEPLEDRLRATLAPRRFTTSIITAFGLAGLFLAAVGIYGVTSYGVGRRRREFAIRLALGANRRRVQRQVLGETVRLVLSGIAVGLPVGMAVMRLIRGVLFGTSPGDPLTYVFAVGLLALVAVMAAWFPVRRATAADPVTALRE